VSKRASIIGAAGYTGGELIRLLMDHPGVELAQIASRSQGGKPLHRTHPNLRGRSDLRYCTPDDVEPCDVLFLAMPHGKAAGQIERFANRAELIVDLSADFRLRDPDMYREWYGEDHPATGMLDRFVYGLPETRREELRDARYISGVGCNATAMNLALLPLARVGLIERVVADIKVGSSEAGAESSASSHHPERSGTIRSYAPTGHRHQGEVIQELGGFDLDVSVTAVELVRGALCTAHVTPTRPTGERELWGLYRGAYGAEPFVRIVHEKAGLHRHPDPKILAGSNYADVGFDVDARSGRVVALCAIDNLVKGSAGSAIQAMNIALGMNETDGLGFPGLHPI